MKIREVCQDPKKFHLGNENMILLLQFEMKIDLGVGRRTPIGGAII